MNIVRQGQILKVSKRAVKERVLFLNQIFGGIG